MEGIPSLTAGLYVLLSAGFVALLAMGARYLALRGTESKALALLSRVYVIVQAVVVHVEAAIRPLMAKSLADGKLTADEAREVKAAALRLVKEALVDQLGQVAKTFKLGDGALDVFLSGLIEQAHTALAPSAKGMPVPITSSATRPPGVAPMVTARPSVPPGPK